MFRVVHCTQVQTLCIADTRLTFNKWLVTNPLALIPYLISAKLLHPQLFLEQVLFWLLLHLFCVYSMCAIRLRYRPYRGRTLHFNQILETNSKNRLVVWKSRNRQIWSGYRVSAVWILFLEIWVMVLEYQRNGISFVLYWHIILYIDSVRTRCRSETSKNADDNAHETDGDRMNW